MYTHTFHKSGKKYKIHIYTTTIWNLFVLIVVLLLLLFIFNYSYYSILFNSCALEVSLYEYIRMHT